jgi:hypothetical protein
MPADPLLLKAGLWLGVATGLLLLATVVGFVAGWGTRFRLVGVTSFTGLLAISCLAFAISYSPRTQVAGAVSGAGVFFKGTPRVIAAAPADLPPEAYRPSVEQVASNLKGSGRTSPDGLVHVRLRRVDSVEPGLSRPVVLAEATVGLHGEGVTVLP